MQVEIRPLWIVAAAAVGLAALWAFTRGGAKETGKAVGGAVAGAVVGAADGIFAGTVEAIGEVIGIPKTNMTECEKAIAEGRTWDASFACPAKDFISYVLK